MQLHKKYIALFAASLLVLPLSLSSCRDDNFAEQNFGEEKVIEIPEGDYLIAFDLKWDNDNSSRADGDLVDGDHQEHEIRQNGLYALFFSQSNELVRVVQMRTSHFDEEGKEEKQEGLAEGRYFATYSVRRSEGKPATCLVLINASTDVISMFTKSDQTFTLNDVLGKVWEEQTDARKIGHVKKDGESNVDSYDYFTMTNATYVNSNNELQCAVPVDINKHFVPEEWLGGVDPYKKWDDIVVKDDEGNDVNLWERVLVIPVERMLAKFTFQIDPNGKCPYNATTHTFTPEENGMVVFTGVDNNGKHLYNTKDYKYEVQVVGWGVNALESQSHLFKNINPAINYFAGWKDANRNRTYWSEDPHYAFSGEYPTQYRKAIDEPSVTYYKNKLSEDPDSKGTVNKNILHNYSYNSINHSFNDLIYIPENTYDNSENYKNWDFYQSSMLHKWVGSHLLVFAELKTGLKDDNGAEIKDIYRDREGVFYKSEKDYFKAMVQLLHNDFSSQAEIEYKYHDWGDPQIYGASENETITINTGKEWVESDAKDAETITTDGEWFLYYGDIQITMRNVDGVYEAIMAEAKKENNEYGATIEASVVNGDGQRMLWFDKISIKDKNKNPLQRCVVSGVNHRGKTIKRNLGPLDDNHRKSLIFEWLGVVDHFKDRKMYYAAPIENMKLGEKNYGVVRNTWYKFSLGNINSLGTPIDNLSEPIVPTILTHYDRINFNIDILGWHNMSTKLPW